MVAFSRTDRSVLADWWWTVDRWTLFALIVLLIMGALLVMAASPAVAERIGLDSFHFVRRQLVLLAPAALIMIALSLATPRTVRRIALVLFVAALIGVVATLGVGTEIKGARRWLALGGASLQPSEFLKPAFVVVAAWLFSLERAPKPLPGNAVAIALCGLTVGLLALQPDIGMAAVVGATWIAQFFLAGLGLVWVVSFAAAALAALVAGYAFMPHVAGRIDRFVDPSTGDNFQVSRALEAFASGGLTGRGPGEGVVIQGLPDAHADFIFAVAGEEFGLLFCLGLIALFAFVVRRGLMRLGAERHFFVVLAASGLLIQFGLQALIHMSVSLHLVPTKGMTLPLISSGGSSLLANALAMGMMLALTRRRPAGVPL